MENPLPEIAEFIGDDITEGDFKVALIKLRAYLDELLGAEGTGLNTIPASVGSGTKPVYTDADKNIVASSSTVGATNKPVFMENGEIKAISGNIGSASQPVYLSNGVLTAGNTVSTNYVSKNNGSLAVGSYAICCVYAKSLTVANGSTTAGSNLRALGYYYDDGSTITHATPSGTWRNVSGISTGNKTTVVRTSAAWALWQRTA